MDLENIGVELDEEEEQALLDELGDALRQMEGKTCMQMVPIWLEHTSEIRAELEGTFDLPDTSDCTGYVQDSPDWDPKYNAMAGWRHAVVWQKLDTKGLPAPLEEWEPHEEGVAEEIEKYSRETREAMQRIYFTEYPENESPYAWSRKTSPVTPSELTVTQLRRKAMRGCWASLHLLKQIYSRIWWETEGYDDPRVQFLKKGMYGTLDDLLKFSDYREKAENGPSWMARFKWTQPSEPNPNPAE